MYEAGKCRCGQYSKDEKGNLHLGSSIQVRESFYEEDQGQLGTRSDGGEPYLHLVKAAYTCRALHTTMEIYPSLCNILCT